MAAKVKVDKARIVNGIFWLYLWLSDILVPNVPATDPNFWREQAGKLFRLNTNFQNLADDPVALAGTAVIPFALWFAIDRGLRRRSQHLPNSIAFRFGQWCGKLWPHRSPKRRIS